MNFTRASEWIAPSGSDTWLIPGFICGTRTLLSGQPKMGKTTLAAHLVSALVNHEEVLGSQPKPGDHKVVWMGFDAGWKEEFTSKFPRACNQVYFAEPITYRKSSEWQEFAQSAVELGASLIVVDHLYQLAEGLDLNESHEMKRAVAPLEEMQNATGIPLLLLSHASKMGSGRAAHSVYLESSFRHLIRMNGNLSSSRREITTVGNLDGSRKIKVQLLPESLTSLDGVPSDKEERKRERTSVAVEQAERFLRLAEFRFRENWTQAGAWFHSQGWSQSPDAGRIKARKLATMGLLAAAGEKSPYIEAGPNLEAWV
jgi:hypothetical protein